ncbi:MAG TPA: VOC family protein [Dehalococcoidia bacterium]|nr:VOC family protein [Dehalococcoidia bacterium]
MASVKQLGYLGIGVSDIEAWRKFATDIYGFEITDDSEKDLLYLRMDVYHHRYVIHGDGNDDLAYVGWEVADSQELQEIAGRLEAAGYRVSAGSKEEADIRRVVEFIKVDDPSGIPNEIFYGPFQLERRPFHGSRPNSGFRTGDLGMGHIIVYQRDAERATHFYRDLLGLRLTDYVWNPSSRKPMTFLHCNPRHHSIGFVETPRLPKHINHFMAESLSIDDVGAAYDAVEKNDVPVLVRLGRHIADRMVSFYMMNPSGFASEFGWDGFCIENDERWQARSYDSGQSIWGHQGLGEMARRMVEKAAVNLSAGAEKTESH